MATQNAPSSGYVTSNGTTLSSVASVPSSDISFSAGLTVTGGDVSINASSNYNVNIGTGTNTEEVNIGNTGNDFTSIAGGEVGVSVAADRTVHISDSYWIGNSIANHLSIGNDNEESTVTIRPPTTLTHNLAFYSNLNAVGTQERPKTVIVHGTIDGLPRSKEQS